MKRAYVQELSQIYENVGDIKQARILLKEALLIYPDWDFPKDKLREFGNNESSIDYIHYHKIILEKEKKILHNAIAQSDQFWNYGVNRFETIKNDRAKKIAFCFRTYDDLHQSKIWEEFFAQANSDQYIIRVRAKHPEKVTQKILLDNMCSYNYGASTYARNDTIRITLKLFENAFKNPEVYKTINLTNSCIPLWGFQKVYDVLTSHNKGIIHSVVCEEKGQSYAGFMPRYDDLLDKNFISKSQWRFNAPFAMVFSRELSKFFAQNDNLSIFENVFGSEEHYFSNNLAHHNRSDLFENLYLQPNMHFFPNNQVELSYLKHLKQWPHLLFYRKTHSEAKIDMDILFNEYT